jgi:hypothetical protein
VEPSAEYLKTGALPYDTVDCDPHVVNGKEVPHCEIEADEPDWVVTPSTDVKRHITQTVGRPHHQHCTNDGMEAELTADGFLRCEDTFTHKKTHAECKVNPMGQRGFVCQKQN